LSGIEVFANVDRAFVFRLAIERQNFIECTVAAFMSGRRKPAWFRFEPLPAIWHVRPSAKTIECKLFAGTSPGLHEVGPVLIGTTRSQIADVAPRTLHTMANATSHKSLPDEYV